IMADSSCAAGASNGTVPNASSEPPLEAEFQYLLFPAIYSIVFVLGLLENLSALYLLCRRARDRPRPHLYMANLCLVDTFFVCVLPFKIHYHLNCNHWIFGDVACRVTGTLFYLNIYLSIAFFTCICVDRYLAVLHPFTYIQIRATHYLLVVTGLWVVALSVAVPLILEGPLHSSGVRNRTACFENFSLSSWSGRMAPYNLLALLLGFVLPFAIILISYLLIARKISQIKHSTHKRKALRTIYAILGICALCFLPYHLTHLLHFLMRVQLIQNQAFTSLIYKMRRVTLALVSFNCCLNPLLYYFSSFSKQWLFSFKLCFRSQKVYTICDQKLGGESCAYKLQQMYGNKLSQDGIL
ncbi:LPAR6 protein, partial [Psilopogon haemacephalus]|nr:LPAR6 protein [Psilopogon haemacephalus]